MISPGCVTAEVDGPKRLKTQGPAPFRRVRVATNRQVVRPAHPQPTAQSPAASSRASRAPNQNRPVDGQLDHPHPTRSDGSQ